MRKAIAVLVAIGAFAVANHAVAQDQAGIRIGNYFGGTPGNPVFYLSEGSNLPVDSYVQVLGGPVDGELNVLSAGGSDTFLVGDGFPANVRPQTAGFLTIGPAAVPGVDPNSEAQFQWRAWRGADTFDAATEKGESALWMQTTGIIPEDVTQQPNVPNMNGPSFVVVPEPTTYLLGLLGGAALFLFRRRK